jgi:hypothetical protein
MIWQNYESFTDQFQPRPSRDTLESWVRNGEVERRQPGGPRGRVYYRWAEYRPETEDALMEALDAAAQKTKRRA